MKHYPLLLLTLFVGANLLADLKTYVEKPDDSFTYEVVQEESMGLAKTQTIQITSQTWNGEPWQHWLYIVSPSKVQHPGKAILIIVGGSNKAKMPRIPKEIRIIIAAVEQLGVPVAVVNQIPNQPLFGNLKEDDIIAHTMTQYFESNDPEDVLLFPMVKSAVRAMDCVSAVMAEEGNPISEFVVSGASKRGWTTYLCAAVDERVIAAAPMVIDMLNMPEQLAGQKRAYGSEMSPQIEPYTSRGVVKQFDTEQGHALLELVDPFAYREKLTMPKLLLLGTNDPFWTVNAANIYFDQLPSETYLHYVPNAGHDLNLTALPTLLSFFKAAVQHMTYPDFSWTLNEDGSTTIDEHDGAQLTLWQAQSPSMDFRAAKWRSSAIDNSEQINIKPQTPEDGFLAYYVQASYPGDANIMPYSLSSQIQVIEADKAE